MSEYLLVPTNRNHCKQILRSIQCTKAERVMGGDIDGTEGQKAAVVMVTDGEDRGSRIKDWEMENWEPCRSRSYHPNALQFSPCASAANR